MKLTYNGLKDKGAWEKAGISLPGYDPREVAERSAVSPVWVHFGIGNIFRIFIGGICDALLEAAETDRGIICAETFDYDVVDKIYRPHDNLALAVTLHADGRQDRKVIASLTEAIKAGPEHQQDRLREIFKDPGLQLVSFTITEKGYALRRPDGEYLPYIAADMENGPEKACGAMGIVTALLYERYLAGGSPLALVSMDNVSGNGDKLRSAVNETATVWTEKGFTEKGFVDYVSDISRVSFPLTMIDKITPRPGEEVRRQLAELGVEDMDIVVTSKKTYIAPFVNAEAPGYLVIEDSFPNGRPPLEKAGVYMTERETVIKSERMKVTACLNPVHTAVCTYACMLGYEMFADGIKDTDLYELARQISYGEGLPAAEDPGIISPKEFLDELMTERFVNSYLGDTSARIAVDISQMAGIRFGETIRAYVAKEGSAASLNAIPLAIAGWLRYLMALDDNGDPMELSPDPMLESLTGQLAGATFGQPDSLGGIGSPDNKLRPILSNERIFGSDLYKAGIGEKIETMTASMLEGKGAVRKALRQYLSK